MFIEDGKGSGKLAHVDSSQRLTTFATTESEQAFESFNGNAYNINTGAVTLTTAGESAVFYMKNTSTNTWVTETLFYLLGNSTSGTGDMDVTVERNPTGGTIVTNAVAVDINANRNFGSSNTLTGDFYKGVEGDTLTGGTDAVFSIFGSYPARAAIDVGTIIMPPGSSIGVLVDCPASNTSQRVAVAVNVFEAKSRDV
jgi:hypothetical protein